MQKLLSYITEIHQEFPQDEIFSLNKSAVGDYSVLTTPNEGNRNPYSSGIFLSQIYLSPVKVMMTLTHKAEFVEWLICGNKASNRTNNASLSFEVVETISHPLQGGNSLLTKPNENIKMPITQHPAVADFPQNLTACIAPLADNSACQPKTAENGLQLTEQKTILPAVAVIGYPLSAFAKSKAEPGNSNLLQGEQQHAYLNRAFFVRSLRTSKETQRIAIVQALRGSLSMVVRNGKGSPFADFLVGQFSSPLRTTAQILESLAVVLSNHYKETAMLFKFLVLGEKRLTISIRAKSEQEARQKLQFTSPALCVARYNTSRTSKGGIYA